MVVVTGRRRRKGRARNSLVDGRVYSFATLGVKAAIHRTRIWKALRKELAKARREKAGKKVLKRLITRLSENPAAEIEVRLKKEGVRARGPNITRALKGLDKNAEALLQAVEELMEVRYFGVRAAQLQLGGSRWMRWKELLWVEGFMFNLPLGHRRPSLHRIPEHPSMSESLLQAVKDDPKLEKDLRRLYGEQDPDFGPRVKAVFLHVIDGWDLKVAAREQRLESEIHKLRYLADDPVLVGERDVRDPSGKLVTVALRFVGTPILDLATFCELQRSRPPSRRVGKTLPGFYWQDGKQVPNPNEAWIYEILYDMRLQRLDDSEIARLTGFTRDVVRQVLQRREYQAIVGRDKWNKTQNVKTQHPVERAWTLHESLILISLSQGSLQLPDIMRLTGLRRTAADSTLRRLTNAKITEGDGTRRPAYHLTTTGRLHLATLEPHYEGKETLVLVEA